MVLGSNPGWSEIFLISPDRPWGPPSLLYNGYRVFFGGKAGGKRRWPPIPSSAEVKERAELFLYSTSGGFAACYRVNFTFTFISPLHVNLAITRWETKGQLYSLANLSVEKMIPVSNGKEVWWSPEGILSLWREKYALRPKCSCNWVYVFVTTLFRSKCKHAVYKEHFDVPVPTVSHLFLQRCHSGTDDSITRHIFIRRVSNFCARDGSSWIPGRLLPFQGLLSVESVSFVVKTVNNLIIWFVSPVCE